MLVRLLDAFVWRNHGECYSPAVLPNHPEISFNSDRQETHQLGFTYVQGMNVLAAPFLYTLPSEMEAFFCFAKFIEESCPLYVQPTLEGVHRGLKVIIASLSLIAFLKSFTCSFWTGVSRSSTTNCTHTFAQKTSLLRYMPFHVCNTMSFLPFASFIVFLCSCSHFMCMHSSS